MALDDDAVEAEEDPAIDFPRIHLVLHRLKGVARKQITDLSGQRPVKGAAQIFGKLFGGSFGGFQGNIAGKAFGHDHVCGPLADVVALDKADIVEVVAAPPTAEAGRPPAPLPAP